MRPWHAGTPLNFHHRQPRIFSLALPADGHDTTGCIWSPPVDVIYPGIPELHLNIPVTDEWVTRNLFAPGAAAQPTSAPESQPSSPTSVSRLSAATSASQGPAAALTRCSKALLRSRHEMAGPQRGDDAQLHERTVAVLRMSMQVHAPGCIHVVLHTAGCQPPFLLQNRTHQSLLFRQAGTQDTWRLLPPQSALGFSWPYITGALHTGNLFAASGVKRKHCLAV